MRRSRPGEGNVQARAGNRCAVRVALAVIGTERHESRRIDNQLRGRAGRQGDPGSRSSTSRSKTTSTSPFGGNRMDSISRMMEKPARPTTCRSQAGMVTAIESAQRQVEAMHFRRS